MSGFLDDVCGSVVKGIKKVTLTEYAEKHPDKRGRGNKLKRRKNDSVQVVLNRIIRRVNELENEVALLKRKVSDLEDR